jgi:hypothetical protein
VRYPALSDPRELVDQSRIDAVCDFMRTVGQSVRRPVVVVIGSDEIVV